MGAAGTMGDHSVPSRGLAHRARYMSFRAEGGRDYTGPLFIKWTHIRRLLCDKHCAMLCGECAIDAWIQTSIWKNEFVIDLCEKSQPSHEDGK